MLQDRDDRLESLREYYPELNPDDWDFWQAGQRVQIIKKTGEGSKLQFGTEVVVSEDGAMSALLGASPGASTAPPIMLNLLTRVFPDRVETPEWQGKLKEIIPSMDTKLADNPELLREVRLHTARVLELEGQQEFVQAHLPAGPSGGAAEAGARPEQMEDTTAPETGPMGDVPNADEDKRLDSATDNQ